MARAVRARPGSTSARRSWRATCVATGWRRAGRSRRTTSSTATSWSASSRPPRSGRASAVVEVGPGLGILTAALLGAGAQVTAVELDDRLAEHLRERFAEAPGFRLLAADFLDVEVAVARRAARGRWWPTCRTTSPAPSSTTSSMASRGPTRFVLMVQREVAERIAAPPGAHELPLGLRPVPRRRHGSPSTCPRPPSSPPRRSTRPSWSARRGHAASAEPRRTSSGGSCRPASASAAR